MEISKHGKQIIPSPHFQPVANTEPNEVRSAEVKGIEEIQSQRLLKRLQGDVEVRNRLLVEVQAKYLAGEYATQSAIDKAAEQILGL
jgi:hypothetical protein